jgi:hypothetical protein
LAASASEQRDYLASIGINDLADELALELDDLRGLLGPVAGESTSGRVAIELVNKLDAKLDSMSGHDQAPLWTIEALSTSSDWDQVRSLAASALKALASMEE